MGELLVYQGVTLSGPSRPLDQPYSDLQDPKASWLWFREMGALISGKWMFPKIGLPKMDGENHRKHYEQMDDFGGTIIFGNTQI